MKRSVEIVWIGLVMVTLSACHGPTRLPWSWGQRSTTSEPRAATVPELDTSMAHAYHTRDQVMQQAYREVAAEVAQMWGDDMVMPSRKVWAAYDDHMTSRRIMDFERGELRVERILRPGEAPEAGVETLRLEVEQAMHDTPTDLAEQDRTMHRAEALARAHGMTMPEPSPSPAQPEDAVLKDIVPSDAAAQCTTKTVTTSRVVGADGRSHTVLTYRVPFIPGFYGKLASRYAGMVMQYAQAHELSPSVILAIMQTESAFNPRAISPIPAYGLMQLVPRSGALDAYLYLYNEHRLLDAEYLFHPMYNIELGSAYLKLLESRYLRAITDTQSRLYCTIAAYNTGAGNVARAFSGTKNIHTAARVINTMSSEQVFERLKAHLPFTETQRYIVKVRQARHHYRDWDSKVMMQARREAANPSLANDATVNPDVR